MSVSVQADDFEIATEMARLTAADPDIGAVVSFTGLVRQNTADGPIATMELEHYPGMTERALEDIAAQAQARWPLQGVRIIHRYGALKPGERIVLVLTASRHRQAAFEAAEFLMDYLKTRAPFWKKEDSGGDPHWVDARDSDTSAASRWEK
jgi:molybdopterin synthase catalytic subunit